MADTDPPPVRARFYIPGLDGVRALSVLGVFAIHLGWVGELPERLQRVASPAGAPLPVVSFFVLSGFLITTLMLREEERTGRIDLVAFYQRRFLRIVPCLVLFLAVLALLAVTDRITMVWRHFVFAALYLGNAIDYTRYDRTLAHTWSLAVEEHFYLVFPLLMVLLPRRVRVFAVVVLLVACTPVRVLLFDGGLVDRYAVGRFSVPAADAILLGCAGAFAWRSGAGVLARLARAHWVPVVAVALLAVPAIAPASAVDLAYTPWLLGLSLALARLVVRPTSAVVRSLEWRPLRAIGIISYGLYVWQGLFLRNGPSAPQLVLQRAPWSVLAAFAAAVASYLIVERPALRHKRESRGLSSDRSATSPGAGVRSV